MHPLLFQLLLPHANALLDTSFLLSQRHAPEVIRLLLKLLQESSLAPAATIGLAALATGFVLLHADKVLHREVEREAATFPNEDLRWEIHVGGVGKCAVGVWVGR